MDRKHFVLLNYLIIGQLELYVMDADSSVDTRKGIRDMQMVCVTEMQGSSTLKDLHLLVCIYS